MSSVCGLTGSRSLAALALAGLLVAQPACAGVSENNRRGILVAGGAAIVIGGLLTIDGLTCDETATGSFMSCKEDEDELTHGLAVLAVGAALIGLGIYLHVKAVNDAP